MSDISKEEQERFQNQLKGMDKMFKRPENFCPECGRSESQQPTEEAIIEKANSQILSGGGFVETEADTGYRDGFINGAKFAIKQLL